MRLTLDTPFKAIGLALLGMLFATRGGWLAEYLEPWHLAAALTGGGLAGWIWNHRRYRRFADTPACDIAAAPQGYVRLSGIGRAPGGSPLLSPAMHGFAPLPCLWYRIKVEERDTDGDWRTVFEDESDDVFLLVDAEGARCAVYPAGATVITGQAETHTEGRERSSLQLLVPGTLLSASGHFRTHSAHADMPDLRGRLRDKLADWKDDGAAQRFDLDRNGELDLREWELVRAAAKREVRAEYQAELEQPDSHSLSQPPDGRPFILSDRRPEQVVRRLRWQAWGCLILFFLGVAGLALSFSA